MLFDYGAVDNELDCQPLPMLRKDFEERKLEYLANLKLNTHEIKELNTRTVEQWNYEEWKRERAKRLTASNFDKICKLRKSISRNICISSILYQSDNFYGFAATR